MREYTTPGAVDVPQSAGLTDAMFERAARDPGTVVMRRKDAAAGGGWQNVTARQFADDVMALAKGLMAAGIAAGDRVALMSRTRYEWTVVDYAIWSAGATTVPIYETSSAEQVEWILTDSDAHALIVESQAHLDTASESLVAAPHVTNVWQIESPAARGGQGEDGAGAPVPGGADSGFVRNAIRSSSNAGGKFGIGGIPPLPLVITVRVAAAPSRLTALST